jgi:hypothetical protein
LTSGREGEQRRHRHRRRRRRRRFDVVRPRQRDGHRLLDDRSDGHPHQSHPEQGPDREQVKVCLRVRFRSTILRFRAILNRQI